MDTVYWSATHCPLSLVEYVHLKRRYLGIWRHKGSEDRNHLLIISILIASKFIFKFPTLQHKKKYDGRDWEDSLGSQNCHMRSGVQMALLLNTAIEWDPFPSLKMSLFLVLPMPELRKLSAQQRQR